MRTPNPQATLRALNPVKVLRRKRAPTPHSPKGIRTSCRRRGLQNSIEVLNIAFSIAETIPVVGPPLKGALEAVCKILGQVERRFQNAEAAAKLIERLAALGRNLSMVESPDLILVELTKRLYTIHDELDYLMNRPGVHYSAIAQALAGFTSDIDSCLLDYIAVVQIRLEERTRVMDVERLATQCVRVLDPFGHRQLIPRVDVQNAGSATPANRTM
ncbi:hypothetical protein FA13DRAFT_815306 [Coprinellus micaceus]|uniref:Uncharacterized protein n=1 Tax=Coprinellus micaceus TaxID=71717 RepID=A0A4Y7T2I8_COPMI|nr:hypothetical protein FA13DRAFT_815306 [Coprinellus micaceus]